MKTYAYDGVLFQKGIVCATCNVEKPARSKHCSKNFNFFDEQNNTFPN